MAVMHPYTVTRRPALPPHAYLQFPLQWGARGLLIALGLALAALTLVWVLSNYRISRLEAELASSHMVYNYARGNEEAHKALGGQIREVIVYVQQALKEDYSPEALRALDSLTAAALEDDPRVRERKLAHALETAWASLTIADANKPLPTDYIGYDGRG